MESVPVPDASRENKLKRWVDAYADTLLRTCYLCLGDMHLAQDALQETFLKAWRGMDKFEQKNVQSEKAWLIRIAMNVCRDHLRSPWHRRVDRHFTPEDLPPSMLAAPQEDRDLLIDICRLPGKYKQVILLYHYHKMTVQETAAALHIPAATAYKRLRKGRVLLKNQLTGREQND
ncbi:MAG: sigma-70 family RNA polymerase sigma factor [Clostridia bacterium]|nr:sigma-70 family RNA polymerase sigma factor [Clostridia bacterium]